MTICALLITTQADVSINSC